VPEWKEERDADPARSSSDSKVDRSAVSAPGTPHLPTGTSAGSAFVLHKDRQQLCRPCAARVPADDMDVLGTFVECLSARQRYRPARAFNSPDHVAIVIHNLWMAAGTGEGRDEGKRAARREACPKTRHASFSVGDLRLGRSIRI
jgi:hypothetical protein